MDVVGSIVWFVLIIAFVVFEAATAQIVSIWFIIGSVVAFVLALFGLPVWLQISAFVVVSAAMLLAFRPLVKRRMQRLSEATNADMVIGKTAVVTEEINNELGTGHVRVQNLTWTARSSRDDVVIKEEKTVTVLRIEGVKLIVEKN